MFIIKINQHNINTGYIQLSTFSGPFGSLKEFAIVNKDTSQNPFYISMEWNILLTAFEAI